MQIHLNDRLSATCHQAHCFYSSVLSGKHKFTSVSMSRMKKLLIIEITWNYKLIRTDLIESRSAVMSRNLVRWNASRPTDYSFVDNCTLAGQQWFKHSTTLSMGWNERQKFVGDPDSMVAIRRVKRLIQFSVLAVLLATLLLFLQWNEISDSKKSNPVKRGMKNQFKTLILRVTKFCRFVT